MGGANKSQWIRPIITLAGVFGFAYLVNWAVLTFFGQKSADRATHSLVGILFLMGYMAIRAGQDINIGQTVGAFFLALIPCYLGTVFPDLDITFLGIGGHRNPFFHSSLSFFILLWWVGRQRGLFLQTMVVGYGVGLASHLCWDVIDYGDVRWLSGGVLDRLWLGVHGILCLTTLGRRCA